MRKRSPSLLFPSFFKQVTGSTDVVYMQLDLCSLKSIRSFAEAVLKTESKLDVLINNAGKGNLVSLMTSVVKGEVTRKLVERLVWPWASSQEKLQQVCSNYKIS